MLLRPEPSLVEQFRRLWARPALAEGKPFEPRVRVLYGEPDREKLRIKGRIEE